MKREGRRVTRGQFEENLAGKLQDPEFGPEVLPVLSPTRQWDAAEAAERVSTHLVSRLPGEPWEGSR